jgi:AsmA protein
MKRKNVISRLTTLALATLACLLLALFAPIFFAHRAVDEPFVGSSVMASPRDLHVVTTPVRLSETPDLILDRGVLYADGNATAGLPTSRFVLDAPVFTLNASGFRAAGVGFESGPMSAAFAPLVEQLTLMGFDTLAVQRGTVHITSQDGTTETISDVDAELTGRRKGVISAHGSMKVRGQRLTFDGMLAQVADKATPSRWPAKLSVKGELLDAGFDGQLDVAEDLQVTGQAEISTPSLRRAVRWFGVPIPTAVGLNAAAFKGQFTWARRSLSVEDAKITLDGNEASGALTLNVAGERPLIDGTLAFSAIDLTPYREAMRSQSFVFERLTSSWSEFDLSFPTIKYFDADLRISAPKIAMNGFGFGRGAAAVTVRSGKMIADVAELELPAGARANAQVAIDTNDGSPNYSLRGRVENFEVGPAAAALFGSTVLSGRSTMVLDVASHGETPAEVMRRLSGKAAMTIPEGGRLAVDIKALRGAAKAQVSSGWGAIGKGQTSLEQLEARVALRNGVLVADAVRGAAGGIGLGVTGLVDIVDGRLDLNVAVKPNVPTDRPLTPADLLGGETVGLHGSWREPEIGAGRPSGDAGEPPN